MNISRTKTGGPPQVRALLAAVHGAGGRDGAGRLTHEEVQPQSRWGVGARPGWRGGHAATRVRTGHQPGAGHCGGGHQGIFHYIFTFRSLEFWCLKLYTFFYIALMSLMLISFSRFIFSYKLSYDMRFTCNWRVWKAPNIHSKSTLYAFRWFYMFTVSFNLWWSITML